MPFDTRLDYCSLGWFVPLRRAHRAMRDAVDALAALPPAEVDPKRAALRRVRDAFVFRNDSSWERPSAAEHIYEQVCAVLRAPNARPTWSPRACEV